MFWFQLGREYKLSVAEILAVFPEWKTVYFGVDFLILDGLEKNKVLNVANNLWWSIKIVEIIDESIVDIALKSDWKFKYWISIFWEKKNLKNILNVQKKELKDNDISSRFINKDFKNLSSAQIVWEKLVKSWTDFNYIYINPSPSISFQGLPLIREEKSWRHYLWKTIWVQDIYSYSKRDYEKNRDMQIGMLPPKLCQMMINISWWTIIYDPFVWLWTVLIESILMWNKVVYGSDLNDKMVEYSKNNIVSFCENQKIELQDFEIVKLNAKFIEESEFLNKWVTSIVTEWYLWEVMTHNNISLDRIDKQKKSLLELYDRFFFWLQKVWYKWNLVICFPFWEIKWKYFYFSEVYDLLNKYCIIEDLLPKDFNYFNSTKSWSLLYKRDKQLVGREIFKLKIKV